MTTAVIMKRQLFGKDICQNSKTEFFSATDLENAGNLFRLSSQKDKFDMNAYFKTKSTQEFIESLEKKFHVSPKINSRGKGQHTWIHPLLFIDMALAISPDLKIEVYQWLFDHLIKNRNSSGDSYKEMSAALWTIYGNKSDFTRFISKVADYIRTQIGVDDWQTATTEQLEKRDKIHLAIKTLTMVLTDPNQCVRMGVGQYKKLVV